MIHRLFAAGLIGSVAAVAVAFQAPAPARASKEMTRSEVQAKVREHFGRLDTNRDGVIAKDEIDQGRMALRGRPGERKVIVKRLGEAGEHGGPGHDVIMEHHGGGGGKLARDPDKAFDRLDANKDGAISRDEFAKGRELRIEKRIVHGGPEGSTASSMRWRDRRGGGGGIAGARMIVMADDNKDGRVTLPEAEAMALRHFDQMDSNRDGRVSAEERRAARPMMMKMRSIDHAPKPG